MPQTINTNIASLNAQRNLNTSQTSLATSMERLSSGLRVNSAKDDAAGLAIADRMNAQIRGMNVAIRNANDGISLAQTAEGALATMTDALQRMRELAVQAQNGSNGTGDRANLDTEFQALALEVGRIATQTKFNGSAIVGASAGAQVFQVGANGGDTLTVTTTQVTTIGGGITTAGLASTALADIDAKLDVISTSRASYGAAMSRFSMAIQNLQIASENQSAARGRIMDADFAPRSCSRPAPRWWRRPTSCRSRCCSCCAAKRPRPSTAARPGRAPGRVRAFAAPKVSRPAAESPKAT